MKLKRRARLGGRVIKKYESLKTPYERVMNNPEVAESYKRELQFKYERLNPFELKKELEDKLKEFKKMSEKPLSLAAQ